MALRNDLIPCLNGGPMTKTRQGTPPGLQTQTPIKPERSTDRVDLERLATSVASSLRLEGFDVTAQILLAQDATPRKYRRTFLDRLPYVLTERVDSPAWVHGRQASPRLRGTLWPGRPRQATRHAEVPLQPIVYPLGGGRVGSCPICSAASA